MYTQIAYRCSFCKKYGLSKSSIVKHEPKCFYNPVSRSCSTCANFHVKETRPSIFAMNDVECLENVKFEVKDADQNKVRLETNCGFWIERPDDEIELFIYQLDKKSLDKKTPIIFFHQDQTPLNPDKIPF